MSNEQTTPIIKIVSTTGKKAVKIFQAGCGRWCASHVSYYSNGFEMVEGFIQMKKYKTENGARKFALKVLA